jgi:hypothetical protein
MGSPALSLSGTTANLLPAKHGKTNRRARPPHHKKNPGMTLAGVIMTG